MVCNFFELYLFYFNTIRYLNLFVPNLQLCGGIGSAVNMSSWKWNLGSNLNQDYKKVFNVLTNVRLNFVRLTVVVIIVVVVFAFRKKFVLNILIVCL